VTKLISAAVVAATAALCFALNAGAATTPSVSGSGTVRDTTTFDPPSFTVDASGLGLSATGQMTYLTHNPARGDALIVAHVVCLAVGAHYAQVVGEIDSSPNVGTVSAPGNYMIFAITDAAPEGTLTAWFGGWATTESCGLGYDQPNFPIVSGGITMTGGDSTPPLVAPDATGTMGANGWYTGDVQVGWDVSDPDSFVIHQWCDTGDVTADTPGETFKCRAASPGGETDTSVTIKRDATPPVVSFSGNAGTYALTDTVDLTCSATDALSGVASQCTDVTGPAWTFGSGQVTVTGTATDNAGNVGAGSTSFDVVVTASGLETLVGRLVTDHGVANSLEAKLAAGNLAAFDHEIDAQTGKKISAADAALLKQLAASL
jgi:hypothetical protein